MKTFFFIIFLITFFSCKPTDTGDTNRIPSPTPVDDEIAKLKVRVTKLEVTVASLIKDTGYKAKQITALNVQIIALKKNDSIYNLKVNSEATKLKNFMYVFSSDSINQWKKINLLYPLVSKFPKDSAKQWIEINKTLALIPKLSFLDSRYKNDSTKQWVWMRKDSTAQWVAIKKLQSASPVTQIPIIQADIKQVQSKNVSQDKTIVANQSSIKNINDTIDVLKVIVGSDFTLDATGKLIISKAGINRLKAEMGQ